MHVSTEDVNALFRRHQGVILLLFVSLLLRSYYLVGFGLGDDAYYASTSLNFLKYGFKALPLSFGSNYRIGIWIPTALSFALFGVNDFSLVLFALASSTLLVLVVYLIALELADEKVALFSAIIQAFSPFDIGFASTLTIDIPSNLLLALSMLFFIKGGVVRRYSSVFYFFSGFCIVWSYFIKIPALSMMLVYAAITITQIRQLKRHIFFYLIFGFLFGSTLAIDFLLSGNPINYVVQEIKFTAKPGFFSDLWMLYPEWMFTARNWLGVMFFGYHFWLAVPAGVYCLLSRDLRGRV
ncbi:MAG: glycosyltransferase family 39 protein, partial [Candidatus Altiarchaeota archaeon]|nr:glycosyltransferase family 39 protein [Candidatus Altiarchaeota archaeon]